MNISQIPDEELVSDLQEIIREMEVARRMIWLHEEQLKTIHKHLESKEATRSVILAEQARRAAQETM